MGAPAAALAPVAAIGTLAGGGSSLIQYKEMKKQKKEEKAYLAEQSALQAGEAASAAKKRKSQIDQLRGQILAPQLLGGRRSLLGGGSETGNI